MSLAFEIKSTCTSCATAWILVRREVFSSASISSPSIRIPAAAVAFARGFVRIMRSCGG